jgi:hypothetical protein
MSKKLLAIAFASTLPFSSMAEEAKSSINYDYVEVGFGAVDIDTLDEEVGALLLQDLDVTSFGGSLSIGENFNLLANTASTSDYIDPGLCDPDCGTIKSDMTRIGVGYHITIQKNTDLQISVSNFDFKVTAYGEEGENSLEFDGHQMSVGFATMLSDSTEASLTFNRYQLDAGLIEGTTTSIRDSGTSIKIVHSISDSIALQAHIEKMNLEWLDLTVSTFGVRYKF